MSMLITCNACGGKVKVPGKMDGEAVCPHCNAAVPCAGGGLPAGTVLGGFRVERLIGEGGMGKVYLAHQLSLGRDVALKVLSAQVGGDRDTAQEFMNEVRVLARLDHPHIVTVHEAGEDQGVLYMAMAYVRGQTLADRIATQGRLRETTALRLSRDMAEALRHAWSNHRLLHRDIKPSNILLPGKGLPQLADFGIAVSLRGAGPAKSPDDIRGTPNYMSPEQIAGGAAPDLRSDIYSLGATLYHAVTGRMPYSGVPVERVLKLQQTQRLPDPREHAGALSRPFAALLACMMAKDCAARPQTWEVLLADIRRVLAGQMPRDGDAALISGAAFRPYAPDRVRMQRIQNRRRLAVAAPAILLVALLGARVLRPSRPAPSAPAAVRSAPAHAPRAKDPASLLLEDALAYGRTQHMDFDGRIERLEAVLAAAAAHPRVSDAAAAELRAIRRLRYNAIQHVMVELDEETQPMVNAGMVAEAITRWRTYDGPHAELSAASRERRAASLEERARAGTQ